MLDASSSPSPDGLADWDETTNLDVRYEQRWLQAETMKRFGRSCAELRLLRAGLLAEAYRLCEAEGLRMFRVRLLRFARRPTVRYLMADELLVWLKDDVTWTNDPITAFW